MASTPSIILHTRAPDALLSVLSDVQPDLPVTVCDSYSGLADAIERTGAEIVYSVRFDGTPRFPRAALVESATVKWVSVGGSGIDHVLPWDPARLTVTNAAGAAADMMAEYALGAMLAFSLGLRGFLDNQDARRWAPALLEPIEGRTLLIIGTGKTGQAVARRAKAMGMRTLGVRAHPGPLPDIDEMHGIGALPGLWGRADFIVCCVPLLPATRGLIDGAAFAAMKSSAVLIDVSRGGVVDEAALQAALDGGRLKGAALDVFASEPLPPDHPFWGRRNVILTPHCSSNYAGWERKCARLFADNIGRYRRGEPLENVVLPGRGY